MRKLAVLVAVMALVGLSVSTASADPGGDGRRPPRPPVTIQVLSVSDWHAQLDPILVGTAQVGGAAVLSSYFKADRAANPNTITLTAGDAFGASPPLSNFFEETPAVLAMNAMGFSADGLGNHNWDRGNAHLQQMIDLAEFPYLSANLRRLRENLDGVEPYEIFLFGRVKVAVIGLTNPEAPTLVTPGNFGTITITDPVRAARRAIDEAEDDGADVIVVIAHMGVTHFEGGDPNQPRGPIVDLANGLRAKDVDLILGDHTDVAFNGVVNGIRVVENLSKGATYSKTQLTLDSEGERVLSVTSQTIVPFAANVAPDQAIVDLLAPYRAQLAPILNTVIGNSSVAIPRTDACGNGNGRTCESLVGNVVADALRSAYATEFALTNSGGLRANLTCPTTDLATDFCPAFVSPPSPITAGQVLTVLPFGNESVTVTISGAELDAFLENGVSAMPAVNGRFPQVSGLCFSYDISAAAGSRVAAAVRQAADGTCTGAAIDLTTASTYTLTTNDFVAAGGDGYPNVLARVTTRAVMDQDLSSYVAANSPISPSIQGRIVCTTSGATACPVVVP